MNTQMFFIVLIGLFFVAAMLSARSKGNRIYCSFTGANKQERHKWVKLEDEHVVFDGKRYDVVPECLKTLYWDRGLHQILPIWVFTADYVWWNRFPIDPATNTPYVMSPSVLKTINNQEVMRSFVQNVQAQAGKKQSKFLDYVPWIALVGLIMFGFYQWQMNQGFNKALGEIGNQLHSIIK